jgi:hypothetical protein
VAIQISAADPTSPEICFTHRLMSYDGGQALVDCKRRSVFLIALPIVLFLVKVFVKRGLYTEGVGEASGLLLLVDKPFYKTDVFIGVNGIVDYPAIGYRILISQTEYHFDWYMYLFSSYFEFLLALLLIAGSLSFFV